VIPVLTAGGAQFVTALALGALAGAKVHTELFDLDDEAEMGHIQLSRAADQIVVCPATANLLARMANGHADDLATTLLLATDRPVLAVPAMNVRMWAHPAVVHNTETLRGRGITVLDPDVGLMACGDYGPGRLPEVPAIMAAIAAQFGDRPLAGRHIIVTAGPTHEPIDPVRFLGNRSSGKQGFAIADALAQAGAQVTLVSGPVALPTPPGCSRIDVETAAQMAAAVDAALPADAAIMVAAVGDWGVAAASDKLKKADGPPVLILTANPDILADVAHGPRRPHLVIGFAAETRDTVAAAIAKRVAKGADWIVANDVSGDAMGSDANTVYLVTAAGVEDWPPLAKSEVALRLVERIAAALDTSLERIAGGRR